MLRYALISFSSNSFLQWDTISEKVAGYREPKPDKTPFFDEGNVQTVQGQWKILTVTDADDINCANSNYCNLKRHKNRR